MSDLYFPTIGDAITINRLFTGLPVRDVGLLASALGRPQASAFGQDAYPDIWSKAASMLHSVIRNHPLEANKRTAVALVLQFLTYNGVDAREPEPEAMLRIAVATANSALEVDKLAVALRVAIERPEAFDPRRHLLD